MMATEQSEENIIPRRYAFVMGFDIGTFSTSVSFALADNKEKIKTIVKWPGTNKADFGGRVPTACLYETIAGPPRIGGLAHRRFYKSDHLFHTSNIKSYLTDATYLEENPLPEGLNPVRLLADYIQQIHALAVAEMKEHFKSKDAEVEEVSVKDRKAGSSEKDDSKGSDCKLVEESEIRFVVSYPDNQNDEYQTRMKTAFEMAGIIDSSDPPHRLSFITESEATAYTCTVQQNIKYSNKPYIVCDIGGTVFGISTLKVFELSETGTVKAQIDQSSSECGNIKLDKNMREYLEEKITASNENDLGLLKLVRQRVFDFYVENIKLSYDDSQEDSYYEMLDISITDTSIQSECFEEDRFIFSYQDMKDKIFGPVVNEILTNIQTVKKDCQNRISGIFISGAIGHDDYLSGIVYERFGSSVVKVASLKEGLFAVSKGLVVCGFRERGRMIPYFEKSSQGQKSKVLNIDSKKIFDDENKINYGGHDYVIGLDFGTTFTGVAYAKAEHCNDPTANHTNLIHVVKNWPKLSFTGYAKVPSMLYFDKDMKYNGSFGKAAMSKSQKHGSDGVLVRHFKLMLARGFDPELDDEILHQLDDFQILDAIVLYLRDFNKEAISKIKRLDGSSNLSSKLNIGYVITIPAMWSDEAKNTMRVAVQKAGLVDKEHINTRVHFITEAEAAAMFCEEFYSDHFRMEKDQTFMICDAGGGTVDLVTFKVSQDEIGNKCISEMTSGNGSNCGSIFLDKAFEEYIVKKFDDNAIKKTHEGLNTIMDHFIQTIKPNFDCEVDADREEDFQIPVPAECEIFDAQDILGFIEDDHIVIKYADIENDVFKPVVADVLGLIDKQLQKLSEDQQQLDAILLVGGFGQSGYLLRKIKDKFEGMSTGARFIGSPSDGHLAICKGAVSFGLRPRMVSEGTTRYSYGLQVKKRFSEGVDDPDQRIQGYGGESYCQNVFSTIIPKDTTLKKGLVYIQKVFVTYPNDPVFAIYSTDEQDIPPLTTELGDYIIKVTAKMPELPHMQDGDRVPFDLFFEITGTDINVEVYHDNNILEQGVTKTRNIVRTKFTTDKLIMRISDNTNPGFFSRVKCFIFPPKND